MNSYDINLTQTNNWFDQLSTMSIGLIILSIFLFLIVLAALIFLIVAECKMFKKAGEAWWKALIPFYSTWTLTKIAGLAWWWFLIDVVVAFTTTRFSSTDVSYVTGFATLMVAFNYYYNIAKKFGKTGGFAVLCTLLPIIGIPMLAFGSAKYDKNVATDINGVFAIDGKLVK